MMTKDIKTMKENMEKGEMTPEDYQKEKEARETEIADIKEQLVPHNDELKKNNVTTVMVRNIPNDYKRSDLEEVLNNNGFEAEYDFAYLPFDFHRNSGLGYAFVNMTSHENAKKIKEALNGYCDWKKHSAKIVEVNWGHPVQGR